MISGVTLDTHSRQLYHSRRLEEIKISQRTHAGECSCLCVYSLDTFNEINPSWVSPFSRFSVTVCSTFVRARFVCWRRQRAGARGWGANLRREKCRRLAADEYSYASAVTVTFFPPFASYSTTKRRGCGFDVTGGSSCESPRPGVCPSNPNIYRGVRLSKMPSSLTCS